MQCTMWPDLWFGHSLTDCCIAHDLGGSDIELARCVADTVPGWGWAIGAAMLAGLTLFGPVYRALRR